MACRRHITKTEIRVKDTKWHVGGSLGEFNLKLLISCTCFCSLWWKNLNPKEGATNIFKELHNSESFVKSLNSSFLLPIINAEGATNIKDFRSIHLVFAYKLISKLLVRRMSKVMDKVISKCQHTFVEGRQILDVVLMVNEVVDNLLYWKREGVLCKLDMEKTYDLMNWDFVDHMLRMISFWTNDEGH